MTKIKLHEMGNAGNFNWYVFDKEQQVAEYLAMILGTIFNTIWEFDSLEKSKNGEYLSKKINIEKYKDYHETIGSNKKGRLDVFYGDKKMFITINCSQKERLKFNEELFKIAEMPKPTKTKKIKK
jgi:hypothetical protein